MKTASFSNRLINAYFELLKNLDLNSKLDLISRLTKSIKHDLKDKGSDFEKAFGAWDESENAEDITKGIRESRCFSRKIDKLCSNFLLIPMFASII